MKKGDYIVILFIIIFSFSLFYFMNVKGLSDKNKSDLYVVITVDGKVFDKEKLIGTDKKINIKSKYGDNVVLIKNGHVKMLHSDCRDQICVKKHEISVSGESIICLPNRVVVSIESEKNNEVDVVLH